MTRRPLSSFADRVRRAFEESGWTIKDLATRADVPYARTHGFIRSGTRPTAETFEKLARTLGFDLVRRKGKGKG